MSERLELAPDTPLSLKEAAEQCLRGLVKASTLRAAAERGDLQVERLGRRTITTPAHIEAWREACRAQKEPDYGFAPQEQKTAASGRRFISSETDRSSAALDSALRTIKALKEGSRQGHAKNGGGPGVRLRKDRNKQKERK